MRGYFALASLIALIAIPEASAVTTGAQAPSSVPFSVEQSYASRAATTSNAVKLSKMFSDWIYGAAIRQKLLTSLAAQNLTISNLLKSSGQKGVLYYVRIERATNTVGMYDLVGNGVTLVGAGTSPEGVAIADAQLNTLVPSVREGFKLDEQGSFYFWITRDAKAVRVTTIPARAIRNAVVRALADRALLATLNEQSGALAMHNAVAHIEAVITDKARKTELADLRKKQEQQKTRVAEINSRLQDELERARRAERAGTLLSIMGTAMTMAYQISTLKTELGTDTPVLIDKAKTPQDLNQIATSLRSDSLLKIESIKAEYNEAEFINSGYITKMKSFISVEKYPIPGVPEMQLQ